MRTINLRKTLFVLPNLFTISSLACGFYSLILTQNPDPKLLGNSAILIVIAMFLDGFDGRIARLTRTQSHFGMELDSLADVISFGIAPAAFVYRWSLHELNGLGAFICFLFAAAGAIRLARFNILSTRDESAGKKKPGKFIVGMPIPTGAGLAVSLYLAYSSTEIEFFSNKIFVAVIMFILSLFMVSPLRFRSFKDVKLTKKTFGVVLFAVLSSIFMAVYFKPGVILLYLLGIYVVISLTEAILQLSKKRWPPYPTE